MVSVHITLYVLFFRMIFMLQFENHKTFFPDTEWTTWFPLNVDIRFYASEVLTVSEVYDILLITRPDDVCRQVLNTQTRRIRSGRTVRTQVRFECLPGTIKRSDFPRVPSDKCKLVLQLSRFLFFV